MTQEREDYLVQRALEAQAAEKAAATTAEPQQTAAETQTTEQQTAGTEPQTARNFTFRLHFNDKSNLEFFFNDQADRSTVVAEISRAIATAYEFSNLKMPNGRRSCTKRQILSGSRFKLSYWSETKEIRTLYSGSTHTNQALQYTEWLDKVVSLILNTPESSVISIAR